MIRKIDLLVPEFSQYDAIHYFTKSIFEALKRLGYECRLINVSDHFSTPIEDPPDLMIAINGIPCDEDGLYLNERNGIPTLVYLIDPPYRYLHLFRLPQVIIGNDDAFASRLLQNKGIPSLFIPHAAPLELAEGSFNEERDIEVLFMATYIDYERRASEWSERFSTSMAKVMREAADLALIDKKINFMEAFENTFNDYIDRNKIEGSFDPVEILIEIELYIKGKSRADLVRSIKETPLHLYNGSVEKGYGWEKLLDGKKSHVTLHPPVNYKEGISLLRRAKIVINNFVKNKEGAHDRVFNAMASEALAASEASPYMSGQFTPGKELLLYDATNLGSLEGLLQDYLSNEELRRETAKEGRRAVISAHTWDHRFKKALDELKELL